MLDQLSTLFEMLRGQLVNVPLNNLFSIVYVILNAFLLLFTPLFGGQ